MQYNSLLWEGQDKKSAASVSALHDHDWMLI
jgi:hypothetical protein